MTQYIAESSSSLHSLVTQALVDTQKYYCPFLERGFCREQSRCNFSHDCQLSTRIPTDYCHFYLANQCLYGQDCKFLHTEPELGPEAGAELEAEPSVQFLDTFTDTADAGPIAASSSGTSGDASLHADASQLSSAETVETADWLGELANTDHDVYEECIENHEEREDDDDNDDQSDNNQRREHSRWLDEVDSESGRPAETRADEACLRRLVLNPSAGSNSESFMYTSGPGENERSRTPSWHEPSAPQIVSQQHDSTPATSSASSSSSTSSSKLRASRVSNRCAMMAPSSSSSASSSSNSAPLAATASLLAKLHLTTPHSSSACEKAATAAIKSTAQISTDNKDGSNHQSKSSSVVASAAADAIPGASSSSSGPSKGAWQNTRLIASIRNNLVESNANKCGSMSNSANTSGSSGISSAAGSELLPLCPYALSSGECPFPEGHCTYLHGEICDLCYGACLHPYNERQRHQHREECLREHEREMELSFAVQRSKDKVCGICMDTVVEKKPITSSRFGILEKCNHIFCLDCIRKWRGTKQFDSRTIRACPECRVSSDFVVPSKYWVEEQDDKEKLITDYKSALRAKPCRYFKEGKGECPFAGSCFYKHAYPDGSLAVLDAPKPRRRLYGARGPTTSLANVVLWNILTSDEEDLSTDSEGSWLEL